MRQNGKTNTYAAQAVPRVYAPSYCAAYAAEWEEDVLQINNHIHRCNGTHGTGVLGIKVHSCGCSAIFYFMEDMIELIASKLEEQGRKIDVTGLGRADREYAEPITESG